MRTRIPASVAAVLLAACNGTTAPVAEDYQSLPADQVMYGVEHNITNGGIRSVHLKADTALMFNDSSAIKLRKVDLELFNELGAVRASLTSQSGELDQNTNGMVARGNVVLVVKGENARTVRTEELHYDPNSKRVWSDVRTEQIFPDGRRSIVDSFSADDQFRNFTAQGLRGATGIRF